MNNVVIHAEGISKRYRLGQRQHYRALRDVLSRPFDWLRNRNRTSEGSEPDIFWALKDISFALKQGEVVGIIGRNGAGKSTLLKILSRITLPTEGKIEIRGRVGSLLEVGTGFHPELTGRENIYLNGAILGMKKADIVRQYDEIVAFSEIEKFIDTPVKFYSSGMYVRLAFAVAAHLEPEILVVDEVLAVGDIAFQKKCLGKMGDVAYEGRTILLVSHQMNAIRKLCHRCLWLDAGKIKMFDSTVKVVGAYETALTARVSEDQNRNGAYVPARFISWEILEPKGFDSHTLSTLEPVKLKIIVQINRPVRLGHHGISLWNSDRELMWGWAVDNLTLDPGQHEFIYQLPFLPLRPGSYSWHVSLYSHEGLFDEWHCVPDFIVATPPVSHYRDEWAGILNIPCDFKVESGAAASAEAVKT